MLALAVCAALGLTACGNDENAEATANATGKGKGNASVAGEATAASSAHTQFAALAAACERGLGLRKDTVVHDAAAGRWIKTGYSPVLVKSDVEATKVAVTPFVGKLVIKDNEAQAVLDSAEAAQALELTPAHLLSNRTHTLVYRFDGTQWHFDSGLRFSKIPSRSDLTEPLARGDVANPAAGLTACLP